MPRRPPASNFLFRPGWPKRPGRWETPRKIPKNMMFQVTVPRVGAYGEKVRQSCRNEAGEKRVKKYFRFFGVKSEKILSVGEKIFDTGQPCDRMEPTR